MFDVFAGEDIYDENGVLLLAKGEKITDEVIANLKRIGSRKRFDSDTLMCHAICSTTLTLAEKLNIRDARILGYAQSLLKKIIFDSKTKPWRFFINLLTDYVDWLFIHSADVAIISLMIALEMGYNDDELWKLGLGAFLHDAGKLLVPKSIIQKPGPLNDMEMVSVRKHSELGLSSLETCSVPQECLDIVFQHHERLDGSGYPRGLKDAEICQSAKIVMIADVIDAITSYRPYKKSQKIDIAVKALQNEEVQYSQELVSVLIKLIRLEME